MTTKYHCGDCGTEAEGGTDNSVDVMHCPKHPAAVIDSIVTTMTTHPFSLLGRADLVLCRCPNCRGYHGTLATNLEGRVAMCRACGFSTRTYPPMESTNDIDCDVMAATAWFDESVRRAVLVPR